MAETTASQEHIEAANGTKASQPKLGLRTTLRAMRHRNFQLFFSGQMISLIGTWMQTIAQDWLVYRLTGSAALGHGGLCGADSNFPARASSRNCCRTGETGTDTVIATQTASMILALVLATLTLSGKVTRMGNHGARLGSRHHQCF